MAQSEKEQDDYRITYYNAVSSKAVDWLWYPYIPYGKITILQGDPGEGKSTMMMQLAALITNGKAMPDGSGDKIPGNVIYQAAEDGIEDTIKPRLEAAGADCSRIAFLEQSDEEPILLNDAVYIQILVNQDNKRMVVRKCEENDKDALRWCIEKPDKRKSRKMSNKLFSAMMYDMMGWDMDCRYKILGYKITHEDETMYIFDLTETEIFMDTKRKKKVKAEAAEKNEAVAATTNQTSEQKAEEVTAKVARKLNRIPFYPKDWQNSFGLPVAEHKKALETNLADGYIEFSSTR